MGKIVVIINKVIPYFKVTTFIWYTKILESNAWMHLQKVISIGELSRKFLKPMVLKINWQRYGSRKINKTLSFSLANKMQQNPIQVGPLTKTKEALEIKQDLSMSELPIVFLHNTNSDYLKFSLGQAKHSNPQSTVYLIGDDSNNCYDFVEFYSFSNYFQGANYFSKIYRHFNTTPYQHELFCFQRWFILHEFLLANKLEMCLYLDSDTLLYVDVTEEQKKFTPFDFTLSFKTCGSIFFLNRVEALADFCQFLTDIYTKKERLYFDRMLAQYAIFKKNGMAGGACDMTAFDFYSYDHFGEIGEVSQIIDGSVFDPGINVPHPGFEMENGIKKIIWKDAVPYGIQLRTAEEIKFNSLHFQGVTKRFMNQYYKGPNNEIEL
ncbi:MAG: hypothetical protein KJP23_05465 [Deltaproteobacteria bacterium]|nr:hypothetical protein [Deltaproteobacteria bacterium]